MQVHRASAALAKDPQNPSLGPLADLLGFHIARAEVATNAAYERHVGKPHKLRKVEYSLLMLVLANGPLSPKTLARVLALSAPSLTMLLDRMQLRGLLRRERSQTDRRSQNVVLTDEGDALARATAAAAVPMEQELRHRLSTAEHAMLVELLAKLAQRPGIT
jgi:DNA-binding MarR family transcriptional regulator